MTDFVELHTKDCLLSLTGYDYDQINHCIAKLEYVRYFVDHFSWTPNYSHDIMPSNNMVVTTKRDYYYVQPHDEIQINMFVDVCQAFVRSRWWFFIIFVVDWRRGFLYGPSIVKE